MICEISGTDLANLLAAAHRLSPSLAEFDRGIAWLDQMESSARSSEQLESSATHATFAAWLLHQPHIVREPEIQRPIEDV